MSLAVVLDQGSSAPYHLDLHKSFITVVQQITRLSTVDSDYT